MDSQSGFLVWLGFPASVHFVSWVFEKRPTKLSLLNLAHTLAIFLVMGAILAVWAWLASGSGKKISP
ncbi:MAG: DUF1761 domain-containing protein [Nitrososphaerales archaeon]|nr:DUF1761 domain-containing protein [Nitrososphaerales archaeon]